MLPLTLARLSSQVGRGQLVLHYLTEKDHPWLRALLDEYERGVGSKQSDLLARLKEPLTTPAPKAKQRLAVEVLQRLTDTRAKAAVPPREARWTVFTAAAAAMAPREETLRVAAERLDVDIDSIETALLADLRSERAAGPGAADLSPERIAQAANLRLVSTWMQRARSVRITAWGNTRALVRQARLHGLICNIRRSAPMPTVPASSTTQLDELPDDPAEGIELEISGPMALFHHTLLYARALSALVPRALWCQRFELRAECETSSAATVATLTVRSESLGSLIFPDFELVHRREADRRWLLEIVGFWTPRYLEEKLRRLRAARLERVILCIDQERSCTEAELPKDALVLRYKRVSTCRRSALQLHGLTTEAPHAVWILIDRKAWRPTLKSPKLEIVRASGNALSHGVETRTIEGVRVKVTTPAKTVADCFRYRRHVGLDVALEALRDYLRKHRGGVDALVAAAKADRIYPFMRPYLEALA